MCSFYLFSIKIDLKVPQESINPMQKTKNSSFDTLKKFFQKSSLNSFTELYYIKLKMQVINGLRIMSEELLKEKNQKYFDYLRLKFAY